MTDDLAIRLNGNQRALSVKAAGAIHAGNAHRLPKVVVGILHQYAVDAVELDLGAVTRIDQVGVTAVMICGREADRRKLGFRLIDCSPAVYRALRRYGATSILAAVESAEHRLSGRPRTGTRCLGARQPWR